MQPDVMQKKKWNSGEIPTVNEAPKAGKVPTGLHTSSTSLLDGPDGHVAYKEAIASLDWELSITKAYNTNGASNKKLGQK